MAQLHSRAHKGAQIDGKPRYAGAAVFNSTTGDTTVDAVADADIILYLADFPEVQEVGEPGVNSSTGVAGNATTVVTVGTGKYWRLIGAAHVVVADANAANRIVTYTTRIADDTAIEAIVHTAVTANNTGIANTVWGAENVGSTEDAASTLDGWITGVLLIPTDEIAISVTNGVAGDTLEFHLFYIEYDNDPR